MNESMNQWINEWINQSINQCSRKSWSFIPEVVLTIVCVFLPTSSSHCAQMSNFVYLHNNCLQCNQCVIELNDPEEPLACNIYVLLRVCVYMWTRVIILVNWSRDSKAWFVKRTELPLMKHQKTKSYNYISTCIGGDLAPSLGGRRKISQTMIS